MNKNKGIIGLGLVLIIVLLIAIVGGGAYYLGKNNERNKNKEVVKTVDHLLEYKTPCDISAISKKAFSFSYPEGYSIKEIKPAEGNVPLGGVMQITIQPNDGSEPIIIGPGLEACRFTGLKLCNNFDDLYRVFTNNNSESSTYAYSKILSTIKSGPSCEESSAASVDGSKTYTYKNHGITFTLPNGYVPHEEQAEGGPAISINLPANSHLSYITDATFWEKYNIPQYKYLKDEKIGETVFKVYTYSGLTIYYFKRGNVAYEYSGDKNFLNSFRFVGWSEVKTVSSEESSTENFKNQPGAIKSIKADGTNKWILSVDLLSSNPNWVPGGENEFFINQNTKIRDLSITANTKAYNCDGRGNPYLSTNTSGYISRIQDLINKSKTDLGLIGHFGYTAYFDISGTNITTIYEQCLP